MTCSHNAENLNTFAGLPASRVAKAVKGRISGDPSIMIRGAAAFESARPDEITLAGGGKFLKNIGKTAAGAVVVPSGFRCDEKTTIETDNPHAAFARVLALFDRSEGPAPGISSKAAIGAGFSCGGDISIAPFVSVGENVSLGERVALYPGVYIGDDVVLGDDVKIFPNVTIMAKTRIGSRVCIHAGSVIGSDGFGYAPEGSGYVKIPHSGFVQIDDDVEIGSCNTIDRAKFGKTHICRGVKTDNLVHIAHNVTVGEDTVIVAQAGIAGSVTIGRHAVLAGQAGIAGHLEIGNNATIGPRAGVMKPVPDGSVVSGTPAMPHRQWLKRLRVKPRLPEMEKRLTAVERRLKMIEDEPH